MSTYSVSPTEKQVNAVNEVIAGESDLKTAMQNAGYSSQTSHNPKQNFVASRGVQAYLGTLDEKAQKKFNMSVIDRAFEVYMDALEATKLVPVRMTVQNGSVAYRIGKEPDHHTRITAADRIVKIYGADKPPPKQSEPLTFNLDDPEVVDWNKKFLEFLEKTS